MSICHYCLVHEHPFVHLGHAGLRPFFMLFQNYWSYILDLSVTGNVPLLIPFFLVLLLCLHTLYTCALYNIIYTSVNKIFRHVTKVRILLGALQVVILLRPFSGGLCWHQHSYNWALLQLHLNSRIHEWNFVWGVPVSGSSQNQRWVQSVKL